MTLSEDVTPRNNKEAKNTDARHPHDRRALGLERKNKPVKQYVNPKHRWVGLIIRKERFVNIQLNVRAETQSSAKQASHPRERSQLYTGIGSFFVAASTGKQYNHRSMSTCFTSETRMIYSYRITHFVAGQTHCSSLKQSKRRMPSNIYPRIQLLRPKNSTTSNKSLNTGAPRRFHSLASSGSLYRSRSTACIPARLAPSKSRRKSFPICNTSHGLQAV